MTTTDVGDELTRITGTDAYVPPQVLLPLPFPASRHEAAGIGRWVAGRRDAVGTGAIADERYTDFAWEIVPLPCRHYCLLVAGEVIE
jgi:hypothetical protein